MAKYHIILIFTKRKVNIYLISITKNHKLKLKFKNLIFQNAIYFVFIKNLLILYGCIKGESYDYTNISKR